MIVYVTFRRKYFVVGNGYHDVGSVINNYDVYITTYEVVKCV